MYRKLSSSVRRCGLAKPVNRTVFSLSGVVDSRKLLHNPDGVRLGWSKDVIMTFMPFTSELITSKGRPFENIAIGYCVQQPPVAAEDNPLGKRRIDDSWLEIILPFSDHVALRDSMIRTDGKTIRYGKLFEILDGLAGDVAYRHCGGRTADQYIVTASVDGMKTAASSIDVKNDLKLQGYLTFVGRSSMEVAIDIITVAQDGAGRVVGSINFIMVARNDAGHAKQVYGLLLANDKARKRFAEGKERLAERRERAQSSLSLTPPRPEEISLIHALYQESMALKQQKDLLMQNQLEQVRSALEKEQREGDKASSSSSSSLAASCLPEPPHLFRAKFKWMRNTTFRNVQIMFPQDRNVHGKIFGGYVMRKAFELAWVSAVCFTGEQNPAFLYVDDIQFVKPVNIGSVTEFSATVVFSRDSCMVVQVEAFDVHPLNAVKSKTNIFRYVFQANASAGVKLAQVMPREYEEIVLYLEGRRALDQLVADDAEAAAEAAAAVTQT